MSKALGLWPFSRATSKGPVNDAEPVTDIQTMDNRPQAGGDGHVSSEEHVPVDELAASPGHGVAGPVDEDRIDIFDGVTAAQRDAACANGYVLGLAGAGTGKTTTLTTTVARRIMIDGCRPSRILVTTFTNEAARTMKSRIADKVGASNVPTSIGSFHSLALRQLRENPALAGLDEGFSIIDPEDLVSAANTLFLQLGVFGKELPTRDFLRDFLNYISILKANLIVPADLDGNDPAIIDPMHPGCKLHPLPTYDDNRMPGFVKSLYPVFHDYIRSMNHADYDDLLLWVTRRLVDDPEYRFMMSSRYDAIIIDEFQDVNRAQFEWSRAMASASGQLFAVGDDGQAIYVWRGAHTAYIREFASIFPGSTVIPLERNFRSTGHILSCANALLRQDSKSVPKELYTTAGDGQEVTVRGYENDRDEAQGVASEIYRLLGTGTPAREIAVLYRTNRQGHAVDRALSTLSVPTVVVGGVNFYSRFEIRVALSVLALASFGDTRQGDPYFERVCNVPSRGLGRVSVAKLKDFAHGKGLSLMAAARLKPLAGKAGTALNSFVEIIDQVAAFQSGTLSERLAYGVAVLGYEQALQEVANYDVTSSIQEGQKDITRDDVQEAASRLANLDELYDHARECDSLLELLDRVALQSRRVTEEAVRLMSVHSSKGLEFTHVYLVGFDQGVFPSPRSDNDEEARLAYVAFSRAKRHMTVSWTRVRYGRPTGPSEFLEALPANARHLEGISIEPEGYSPARMKTRYVDDPDLMARLLRSHGLGNRAMSERSMSGRFLGARGQTVS